MKTVLIADDETNIRDLLVTFMELEGHDALAAANGEEAWSLLQSRDGQFDLVISDVKMPGLDGWELAEKIHLSYPSLRVILISGYSERNFKPETAPPNIIAFVSKPFSRSELMHQVSLLLCEHKSSLNSGS